MRDRPSDAPTPGLFTDHGHGRRFVQESKLSVRVLRVRRVHEDAALEERAMEVRYQGADVT